MTLLQPSLEEGIHVRLNIPLVSKPLPRNKTADQEIAPGPTVLEFGGVVVHFAVDWGRRDDYDLSFLMGTPAGLHYYRRVDPCDGKLYARRHSWQSVSKAPLGSVVGIFHGRANYVLCHRIWCKSPAASQTHPH